MLNFWQAIITAALSSLFSWPVAVVILGFVLKREISGVLARLSRLGFRRGDTSVEALMCTTTAVAQIEKSETGETDPLNLPAPEVATVTASTVTALAPAEPVEVDEAERQQVIDFGKNIATVQAREELIKAQLTRLGFATGTAITTEVLIRNLAYSQAMVTVEKLYRIIFGSQIELLRALNTYPRGETELLELYTRAYEKFPKFYASYSYEEWRDFLINQGAMVHDAERQVYAITAIGREFLVWMANTGISGDKMG